ncbi:MAG: aminotransferase class IV [Acidobacteriota bacterium]
MTPSLATGCLPGITRDILLALARRAGIAVRERATGPEALRGASEAFLTNSTGGVIPVRSVGGRRIGARCPGPLTTTLATAYDEEIVIDSLRRGGS